jgi:hypothetical protein
MPKLTLSIFSNMIFILKNTSTILKFDFFMFPKCKNYMKDLAENPFKIFRVM